MKQKKEDDGISLAKFAALEAELNAVKKEYGVEDKKNWFQKLIARCFDPDRQKPVNRRKYILLTIFTGWMGGHRFYAGQYPSAILYLAFFWTGFPLAMTLIDLMVVIPKKPDENGNVLM